LGRALQEGSGLLPESSLMFKALLCYASSDISFIFHSVEEGDGMGCDAHCTPNVRKSVYQGVLVLLMGSSGGPVLARRPSYGMDRE